MYRSAGSIRPALASAVLDRRKETDYTRSGHVAHPPSVGPAQILLNHVRPGLEVLYYSALCVNWTRQTDKDSGLKLVRFFSQKFAGPLAHGVSNPENECLSNLVTTLLIALATS